MALETLTVAQEKAEELMDFTATQRAEMREAERPVVYDLGVMHVEGEHGGDFPVFRAHSGPDNATGKGGIRAWPYETRKLARNAVKELSVEMLGKLYLRNLVEYKGAKGLIVADFSRLTHEQKVSAIRQYENLMEDAGLVGHIDGHSIDVPAGDIATNGLSSEYALERHRRHPDDIYWQSVITGKNPREGGLAFRAAATGYAAWVAHTQLLRARGEDHASVALQGFGNVGAWYAFYAATDPQHRIRIQAIGEREGTLYTSSEYGLQINESTARTVGDNADYLGDKLAGLYRQFQSSGAHYGVSYDADPKGIVEYNVDYFVPAAMGNVLTSANVARLGARKGVLEIANGPTASYAAHRQMVERGLVVAPDIWINGGGVDASAKEHAANIALANHEISIMPSTEHIKNELQVATTRTGRAIFNMAEVLGTPDLRVAAAAVSIARFAGMHNITVDRQFFGLVA